MSTENHALAQAVAQCESIVEMVAAMECDYGRLEELRELKRSRDDAHENAEECLEAYKYHDSDDTRSTPEWTSLCEARDELESNVFTSADAEELAELEAAAGDFESEDDARERIQEDPLSIEVRSDWHAPGESGEPSEFCILLCTGGPAVRIVGDLYRGEPSRPRVEYQDWGTPWTEYFPTREQSDALQSYVSCFYFGE